jgi:hypothetical protein
MSCNRGSNGVWACLDDYDSAVSLANAHPSWTLSSYAGGCTGGTCYRVSEPETPSE